MDAELIRKIALELKELGEHCVGDYYLGHVGEQVIDLALELLAALPQN